MSNLSQFLTSDFFSVSSIPPSISTRYYPVFVTGSGIVTPNISNDYHIQTLSSSSATLRVGGLNILYNRNSGSRGLGIGIPNAGAMNGDYNTSIHGTGTYSGTYGNTLIGWGSGGNGGPVGSFNTIIGYDTGGIVSNSVNSSNTLIGANSGRDMNVSSSDNIMIGVSTPAGTGGGTYNNNIFIGNAINTNPVSNRIVLGTSTHTRFSCYAVHSATGLSGNAVYVTNTGILFHSPSSIRYKTEVEDAEYSYSENIVFNSKPKWFRSLCELDNPNWSFWGFIAEEIAEIDPRLVNWKTEEVIQNEEGVDEIIQLETPIPNGVDYDKYVVHLVAVAQKQKQEIDVLKEEIDTLKDDRQTLETKVSLLEEEIVPYLTKAIQEQQELIESQKVEIESIKSRLDNSGL